MLLHELLTRSACTQPHAVALRCGEQSMVYGELHQAANSVAAALGDRAIAPGDRVVAIFEKSIANIAALFGAWRAGGVAVNLNANMPPSMLASIIADCRPRFILGSGSALAPLLQRSMALPASVEQVLEMQDAAVADLPTSSAVAIQGLDWREPRAATTIPVRAGDDLAAIIYTSGSTGRQKGVMLSHRNLLHHVESVTAYLRNSASDRLISILPLSFGYGLSQLLTAVGVGASLTLVESFVYPNDVLALLSSHRITGIAGVPSHFQMLLAHGELSPCDLSSLRYLTISGSTASEGLVRGLRHALPHVRVYLMFGQTESCIRSCYLDPDEVDRRPTSIGKSILGVQVLVLDDRGREVGPGDVGELVCRGPNLMMGYWNDAELTNRALRPAAGLECVAAGAPGERVLYTGDLVRRDAQGFLYFVGRRDEMIKCGAHRIFPLEVERVLQQAPGVREAAVVAEPDLVLGQVVAAHVVVHSGAKTDPRAILAHCRRHLPPYMVPRRLTFDAALPKTATGKIRKADLAPALAGPAS